MKLTITFKGREMQFQEIGRDLFKVQPSPYTQLGCTKQIHFHLAYSHDLLLCGH